jgi:hypothetical protein
MTFIDARTVIAGRAVLEFHIAELSLLRRKPDERLRFLHNPHNENESSRLESVHASPAHRLSLVYWSNPIPGGSRSALQGHLRFALANDTKSTPVGASEKIRTMDLP